MELTESVDSWSQEQMKAFVEEHNLLEFPGAEGEIARRDLVAEGLAYLADAEGNLLPGSPLDVLEVQYRRTPTT